MNMVDKKRFEDTDPQVNTQEKEIKPQIGLKDVMG